MKHRALIALIATATLIGASASVTTASASQPKGIAVVRKAPKERHPELRKAMNALERAQSFLAHANRDFAGHREKAADLIQRAMAEVKQAIAADKG